MRGKATPHPQPLSPKGRGEVMSRRPAMDERLRLFAWIAGSGGCFGLLGAGFGAVTGFLCWRGGRAAGTGFGIRLARAFERTGQRPFSPSGRGCHHRRGGRVSVPGGGRRPAWRHCRSRPNQGTCRHSHRGDGAASHGRGDVLWGAGLCGQHDGSTRRGRALFRGRRRRRFPATGWPRPPAC